MLGLTSGSKPFSTTALFGFTYRTFSVLSVSFILPFDSVENFTSIYPAGFSESSFVVFGITSSIASYWAVTVILVVIDSVSFLSQASVPFFCFHPVSALTVGFVISANVFAGSAFGFT